MGITSCGRATVGARLPASIGTFYPPRAPTLVPRDNGYSACLKSHMPITSVGMPIRRYAHLLREEICHVVRLKSRGLIRRIEVAADPDGTFAIVRMELFPGGP